MSLAIWTGSALWSSASWIARRAAKSGYLPVRTLDARVISVGNLQAGGAGKTPLVAQIAREACERGLKVCILTRGYQSDWEIQGGVIEPGIPPVDPQSAGDEPALLQQEAPGAWIAVGADRARQYELAKQRLGSKFDLVILDDGFQHWKLKKNIEVLAVTSAQPNQRVFRDWMSEVSKADLVVWTKGDLPPHSPFVKVRYQLNVKSDKPVWIVCGVADPLSVVRDAKAAGLEVRREIALEDHAEFDKRDVGNWLRESAAQGCRVAITGKDWVKWRALGVSPGEVLVLEPRLEFERGREIWERVLWG